MNFNLQLNSLSMVSFANIPPVHILSSAGKLSDLSTREAVERLYFIYVTFLSAIENDVYNPPKILVDFNIYHTKYIYIYFINT